MVTSDHVRGMEDSQSCCQPKVRRDALPNILPDGVLAMTVFLKPPGGTHPEPQGITYIRGPNNKEPLKISGNLSTKKTQIDLDIILIKGIILEFASTRKLKDTT